MTRAMIEVGLSVQRTGMAWRRTAMSAAAVALLAARPAFAGDAGPVQILGAAAGMAGWVALVAIAYRRSRGLDEHPPRPGRRTLLAYALITVLYAITGLFLVLA
jgi:uncharacterized membrane protein YidH (DUF202 family)